MQNEGDAMCGVTRFIVVTFATPLYPHTHRQNSLRLAEPLPIGHYLPIVTYNRFVPPCLMIIHAVLPFVSSGVIHITSHYCFS
jgi:hypothetical protein